MEVSPRIYFYQQPGNNGKQWAIDSPIIVETDDAFFSKCNRSPSCAFGIVVGRRPSGIPESRPGTDEGDHRIPVVEDLARQACHRQRV